jgi:nickel-type superoxide dismutase maturation protease
MLLALIGRVQVEGDSMIPTLYPGDRLVVARRRRVRVGDIVAARDPRGNRILVKRVSYVEPGGGVMLQGDNSSASTDSREFGAVARSAILGRVVYRYAPAARAGRVG